MDNKIYTESNKSVLKSLFQHSEKCKIFARLSEVTQTLALW